MAERELPGAGRDRFVNMAPAQHSPDGGVAGAQALGGGDDVGDDRQALGGQPVAGPAAPGPDLGEADQKAVLVAALRKAFPESPWRAVSGERGGADGLAEVGGHILRTGGFERSVQRPERLLAGGV